MMKCKVTYANGTVEFIDANSVEELKAQLFGGIEYEGAGVESAETTSVAESVAPKKSAKKVAVQ